MIPSFTPVEWAIVGGAIVSSVTLIFVFLDFYWSHLATEKSDVSIRKSASRGSNHSRTPDRHRVSSPCTIANEGKRSAVVRATRTDIEFEPSGTEFSWEEMKRIEPHKNPSVAIRNVDDNSISADSTVEGIVWFHSQRIERLNSLMDSQKHISLDVVIDVEDNRRHYQINYSDKIELQQN